MNNNIILLVEKYYSEPVRLIFEKMLSCNIYCLSNLEDNNYQKIIDNDYNIIINYMNNSIINILKQDGYKFKVYNITNNNINNYKVIKKINNKINIFIYIKYVILLYLTIYLINNLQKYIRSSIGYEINKGSFERIEKRINSTFTSKLNIISIIKNYFYYKGRLKEIYIDKPKKCLKIEILSNEYIFNKLYYDYTIENLLSNKNMKCDRYIGKTYINKIIKKYYMYKIKKYCKYDIGSNSIKNIYKVKKALNLKYDGIIFISNDENIIDECTSLIIESICKKENMPMINIKFDNNINKLYIDNNINMLYDLININNTKKKT